MPGFLPLSSRDFFLLAWSWSTGPGWLITQNNWVRGVCSDDDSGDLLGDLVVEGFVAV
jgi:hypothetical protein